MLEKLMQSIFTSIAALLADKWTGDIVIRIKVNNGGIRDARFGIDKGIIDEAILK